jgi:hypothetical protein
LNPNTAILWPMGALVALVFAVQLQIPVRRFRAGAAKRVTEADFRYGESANVPGEVSIPNRNYINLFEAPVLFYVACLTLYATSHVDTTALAMAWLYVALRIAHSIVHLTYNKLAHRGMLFALSNVVLASLWIRFFATL